MKMLLFFSTPGGMEWFVILIVALLLFGRRLPEVARSMGKSITEFKKGIKGVSEEVKEGVDEVKSIKEEVKKDV